MIYKIISATFLFLLILISPLYLHAESVVNSDGISVEINYPYYRNIEKTEVSGKNSYWPKESRTEEKIGRSLIFDFILGNYISDIPLVDGLLPSEKSSKNDKTVNSPEYVNIYNVSSCDTLHKFSSYNSFLQKFDKIIANKRTVCRGRNGSDTGKQVIYEAPQITQQQIVGENTIEYGLDGKTIKKSRHTSSKAIITVADLKRTPENACVKYGRFLVETCAKQATSFFVPGGFIISSSGVIKKISRELENLIFKNNPTWSIPIKVNAYSLSPNVYDGNVVYNENSIPCGSIKVLGKKLNSECSTIVKVSEKDARKDITPTTDFSKYYRYDISVSGSPVKEKSNIFSVITNLLTANVFSNQEDGNVVLDDEGFMVVYDDNVEYLPMSPDVSPSPSSSANYQTYPNTPYINSISNSIVKRGDIVSIEGRNFQGVDGSSIFITSKDRKGQINPSLISVSPTNIKFQVPNIPNENYDLSLIGDKGESNTINLTVFGK
jgi:hypothetical protein